MYFLKNKAAINISSIIKFTNHLLQSLMTIVNFDEYTRDGHHASFVDLIRSFANMFAALQCTIFVLLYFVSFDDSKYES